MKFFFYADWLNKFAIVLVVKGQASAIIDTDVSLWQLLKRHDLCQYEPNTTPSHLFEQDIEALSVLFDQE